MRDKVSLHTSPENRALELRLCALHRSGPQAYIQETLAFCDCLVKDEPSPCSGEDGLMALIMSIAAGMSAEQQRWVR